MKESDKKISASEKAAKKAFSSKSGKTIGKSRANSKKPSFKNIEAEETKKENIKKTDSVEIIMKTDMGDMEIELYPDKAPVTVENFINYIKEGFFNGLIFHRVINGFMIQGGGFNEAMEQKPGRLPIKIEADNGLSNDRGTIAMARTAQPDSATSQFFINLVDNSFLNHRNKTPQGWGYAVFGKVIKGMETADAIASVPTGSLGYFSDVPEKTVRIKKVMIK